MNISYGDPVDDGDDHAMPPLLHSSEGSGDEQAHEEDYDVPEGDAAAAAAAEEEEQQQEEEVPSPVEDGEAVESDGLELISRIDAVERKAKSVLGAYVVASSNPPSTALASKPAPAPWRPTGASLAAHVRNLMKGKRLPVSVIGVSLRAAHIDFDGKLSDVLRSIGCRITIEGTDAYAYPPASSDQALVARARELIRELGGRVEVGVLGSKLVREGFAFSSLSQTLRRGGVDVSMVGSSTAIASTKYRAPAAVPAPVPAPSVPPPEVAPPPREVFKLSERARLTAAGPTRPGVAMMDRARQLLATSGEVTVAALGTALKDDGFTYSGSLGNILCTAPGIKVRWVGSSALASLAKPEAVAVAPQSAPRAQASAPAAALAPQSAPRTDEPPMPRAHETPVPPVVLKAEPPNGPWIESDGGSVFQTQTRSGFFELTKVLPPSVALKLLHVPNVEASLIDVVLDLGRPLVVVCTTGRQRYSDVVVTQTDLDGVLTQCGRVTDSNRMCIGSSLHRCSVLMDGDRCVGLTLRLARTVDGLALAIDDILAANKSVLLVGPPGRGKTTLLRSICQLRASANPRHDRSVFIVDTYLDLAGSQDVPHSAVGDARRIKGGARSQQYRKMQEVAEGHAPQTLVVDEIGAHQEVRDALSLRQSGLQLIASVRCQSLLDILQNPTLKDLVGGVHERPSPERRQPPAFDTCVEMLSLTRWRIHHDICAAVDCVLREGQHTRCEIRELFMDAHGKVTVQRSFEAFPTVDRTQLALAGASGI